MYNSHPSPPSLPSLLSHSLLSPSLPSPPLPFLDHHHHHWAVVVSGGWAKASACRLQITLSCRVLCHIVSLQYWSRSSLQRLAGLPCRLAMACGLQVVTCEVHRSSLRRLICPAQDHFIFITVLIISMTFVISLTKMLVFLSLYVMLSILLSILVCAAASLFCGCLVSVQVSAPYVIAGSTHELYTCLFRQMERLSG